MNYDECLKELGEFGRWQVMITFLVWIPAVLDGIMTLTSSYTALEPTAYRCNIPSCDDPQDFNFLDFPPDLLFPSLAENSSGSTDYCHYYRPSQAANGTCSQMMTREVESCNSESNFRYAPFKMSSTLITEYGMMCDESRYIWIPMFNSFFMLGLALGSIVFGVLSDKLGRRHTLLLAIIVTSVPSVVASQVEHYISYAMLRALVGAGSEGCFLVAFAMALEVTGSREAVPHLYWVSYLTLQGNLMSVPFALGEMFVSFAAMELPEWRHLELVMGLTGLIGAVTWLVLPESPRWLIAKGRLAKARQVLVKAAQANGVVLSPHLLRAAPGGAEEEERPPQYGLQDCFRLDVLAVTLTLLVCWPVVTLLYYGLTFSADTIHLTENTYLSFISITLIELPSVFILILLMDIWGRKPLMVVALLLPGATCIAAGLLQEGITFTLCVLLGKLCTAGAFNILHIVTAELYPTSVRNTMLGVCSTVARVGGMMAPWLAVYLPGQGSISTALPLYIFGGLSAVAGLLALTFLTESLGSSLPDTFDDVKEMKERSKSCWSCVWPVRREE